MLEESQEQIIQRLGCDIVCGKQATNCVITEEDQNVQAELYNVKIRTIFDKILSRTIKIL